MRIYTYARCKNEADRKNVQDALRVWANQWALPTTNPAFDYDLQSGQRGLRHTLRALEQNDILLLRHLSDLGRDMHQLLNNASALRQRGVTVRTMAKGIDLDKDSAFRLVDELLEAHRHYGRANIRLGVKTAKIGGALVGRPPRPDLTLERVRKLIKTLTNANAGVLPSVRTLAKHLKCSTWKAHQLLQQTGWKGVPM